MLKVYRKLLTAHRPQTDVQTEHVNSVLGQYLHNFINENKNDWMSYLPLTEFAYNNTWHASTKKTYFGIVYGKESWIRDVLLPENFSICDRRP